MKTEMILIAIVCGGLHGFGADRLQDREDFFALQREMMRQTSVLEQQAYEMSKANDLLRDAKRTPEERARIAEEQKRAAEQARLEAAQAATNRALRVQHGLHRLPPGYDERYKVTERQIPAIQAAQRLEAQRRAERLAKDAPKREAWLKEREARRAELNALLTAGKPE